MLFPLIEFGSIFFIAFVVLFLIAESVWLHTGSESTALVAFMVVGLSSLALVSGWPQITWHWAAAYFVGGFVWIPTFWYLVLRRNRSLLLTAETDYQRERVGKLVDLDSDEDVWIPKHPDSDEIAANGLLWFIAAPIHLARDWVNIVIDFFSGIMTRIQKSMAVTVPVTTKKYGDMK